MVAGEWVTAAALRREVPQQIYEALAHLESGGWRLRRAGHKATLYCPCGADMVAVPGSPKNADNAARRLLREANRCPDRHPNA